MSKLSWEDWPRGRFGSIPDCEHGEVDLPWLPPPLIDLPVVFFRMLIGRLGGKLAMSEMGVKRLVRWPPYAVEPPRPVWKPVIWLS